MTYANNEISEIYLRTSPEADAQGILHVRYLVNSLLQQYSDKAVDLAVFPPELDVADDLLK